MSSIEILGLLATTIIFVSFTFSDMWKVRCMNAVGCILFIIYGVLIGALSVWVMNGLCFLLQMYKLCKEFKSKSGQKQDNLDQVS